MSSPSPRRQASRRRCGTPQQAYVLGRFGKDYPRRGWTKPLLLAVLGIIGFVAGLGIIGGIIGFLLRA